MLISKCVFESPERPCELCERRGLVCGIEEKVLGPKSRIASTESLHLKKRQGYDILTIDLHEEPTASSQSLVQPRGASPGPSYNEGPTASHPLSGNLSTAPANQVMAPNAHPFAMSQSVPTQLLFPTSPSGLRMDQSHVYKRRGSHPEWSVACYSCITSSQEVACPYSI